MDLAGVRPGAGRIIASSARSTSGEIAERRRCAPYLDKLIDELARGQTAGQDPAQGLTPAINTLRSFRMMETGGNQPWRRQLWKRVRPCEALPYPLHRPTFVTMNAQEDHDQKIAGLRTGADLALDLFRHWRRDLPCLDALILLAITKNNVDGMLHSRDRSSQLGEQASTPPDSLRLPVSITVVATSLRLPAPFVYRRVKSLAASDECEPTPSGMVIITQRQVENTNRLSIVQRVYADLTGHCAKLIELGVPYRTSQGSITPSHPPLRVSSAYAARYCLQLLALLGRYTGDSANALLLLQIFRSSGWQSRPTPTPEAAGAIGLSPRAAGRRMHILVERGICRPEGSGVTAGHGPGESWFVRAAQRNMVCLSQLLAGLAEIGALTDLGGRRAPDR